MRQSDKKTLAFEYEFSFNPRLPMGDGYHPLKQFFQAAKTLVFATKMAAANNGIILYLSHHLSSII